MNKLKQAGLVIAAILFVFWVEINLLSSAQDKADICLGIDVIAPALDKATDVLFGCAP